MDINASTLSALRVGFNNSFQAGLGVAPSQVDRLATVVPASTKEVKYGWLAKLPMVREWIGPRLVNKLSQSGYSIIEKPLELTIGVDRDDIETDNIGIYAPLFQEMGQATGSQWDRMVIQALTDGFTSACYDNQFFFDTDHPVVGADGNTTTVSNTGGGGGNPWFLLCTQRAIKPIILQRRRDFDFVSMDRETDQNVFMNKEFVYGSDARGNVGYGFWQMAYGSRQTLNATSYAAARAAIMGFTGDGGRPLGLIPNLLVVGGSNESAGRKILMNENSSGGETNEWKGTAELFLSPWLV
jgi:phage major head subunit gpT-like protein